MSAPALLLNPLSQAEILFFDAARRSHRCPPRPLRRSEPAAGQPRRWRRHLASERMERWGTARKPRGALGCGAAAAAGATATATAIFGAGNAGIGSARCSTARLSWGPLGALSFAGGGRGGRRAVRHLPRRSQDARLCALRPRVRLRGLRAAPDEERPRAEHAAGVPDLPRGGAGDSAG